jgi:hypothetical protein
MSLTGFKRRMAEMISIDRVSLSTSGYMVVLMVIS